MSQRYYPAIDGLRAIAVLGVLLFHFRLAFSGGYTGVDVFFVISGFLISDILWREYAQTGTVDLVNFWSRRFRRLMPMAILVVLVTLVAIFALDLGLELKQQSKDATLALLYVTNWHEFQKGVDYFAGDDGQSYFLHYWSLAVEEQFYVLTSLVLGLVLLACQRNVGRAARFLVFSVVVLSLVSFLACLYFTSVAQPAGFFGTQNRVWQFGAGVAITIGLHSRLLSHVSAPAIGSMAGLVLIVASFFVFDGDVSYPGVYALVPTLGAALVIVGCVAPSAASNPANVLLGSKAFVFIGRISYSLYLWHWPIALILFDLFPSSWPALIVALVLVFFLSAASYHFVESPLRKHQWLQARKFRTLAAAVVMCVIGVVVTQFITASAPVARQSITLADGSVHKFADVKADMPEITSMPKPRCHVDQDQTDYPPCVFGKMDADKTIVLFGDSHAAHWFPAIEAIAIKNGYRLLSRTKSACSPMIMRSFNTIFKREYVECDQWREKVLAEIASLPNALVIIGSSKQHIPLELRGKDIDPIHLGTARLGSIKSTLEKVSRSGVRIVLISDTPWFNRNPLKCLALMKKPESCGVDRDRAVANAFPWFSSDDVDLPNAVVVNMNDSICPKSPCLPFGPSSINFRDNHHMTAGYSRTLGDELYRKINDALERTQQTQQ